VVLDAAGNAAGHCLRHHFLKQQLFHFWENTALFQRETWHICFQKKHSKHVVLNEREESAFNLRVDLRLKIKQILRYAQDDIIGVLVSFECNPAKRGARYSG